ncbi:MAG: hypothetical protein ISR64_04970 [Deltaproteobacteria bacterium]|nr:hypothetical protein [Deltaproteobacteria bacterium]
MKARLTALVLVTTLAVPAGTTGKVLYECRTSGTVHAERCCCDHGDDDEKGACDLIEGIPCCIATTTKGDVLPVTTGPRTKTPERSQHPAVVPTLLPGPCATFSGLGVPESRLCVSGNDPPLFLKTLHFLI